MRKLRLREVKHIREFVYSFNKDVLNVHLFQKFSNSKTFPIYYLLVSLGYNLSTHVRLMDGWKGGLFA